MQSAKKEFLEHGFEKASLKTICERAQVTTGALYKRYRGKEDLFCAVVKDTVDDMYAVAAERTGRDIAGMPDEALLRAWDMEGDDMLWWFRYLYAKHDDFVLLLRCAEGTAYSNFQHDWVEMMTDATWMYYAEAYRRGLATAKLDKAELHILLTAFWTTIYEPFIHGYVWSQIEEHCRLVCRLFNWYRVKGFRHSEEKTSREFFLKTQKLAISNYRMKRRKTCLKRYWTTRETTAKRSMRPHGRCSPER